MEYVQLYPEYDFIFLGDNGQGDAMCADRVIEKAGESLTFENTLACLAVTTRFCVFVATGTCLPQSSSLQWSLRHGLPPS